ncbi:hypothetical protein ACVC7V_21550 [Hydrogenophaga sp. A37]|uniref:hypothetical protein n=1 Tax=Hydrogenophaga sp. A37 TaxID=1945864 RepID=UPI00098764EF|nr:hypothetical protein [Hydrogenophaga sp. A37]OOG84243.1 hypothetical protein B0E41_10870 [Hydrogenophaga sp. A37]
MADLNLVFSRARYTGGPISLVFGYEDAPPAPDPLTAHGTTVFGFSLTGSGLVAYENRNPRRVSTRSTQVHQTARAALQALDMPSQQAAHHPGGHDLPMQQAQAREIRPEQPIGQTGQVRGERAQVHEQGTPIETARAQVHQITLRVRTHAAQVHQIADHLQALASQPHQIARLTHTGGVQALQIADRLQALALQLHQRARAAGRGLDQPLEQARKVPPGKEVWPPVPTGPGFEPHVPDLNLVFACPPYEQGAPLDLVFGHVCALPPAPGAPLFILPARYYMAVHSLTCHKLPSMEPVPIFGVNLSAAEGSFGWSFSAEAPPSVFDQLAATGTTPTRVLITLDGLQFEFVLDEPEKSEAFGGNGTSISGRSATALLSGFYALETARHNTAAATAQQLALAALEFTGFALDWGLPDWLVPAGAWSHIGTPLAAVQALVASAGGHLQSHRNAATLQARHPYPDLTGGMPGVPWNWADPSVVPDIELAPDAVLVMGTSRVFGADINGVYVSGTTHPPRALYKRQGTAGDKLASLITDPLIVAPEVARMRGRSVVGAAGLKQFVTLELPVLTGVSQPGVIDPGKLLQVNHAVPWRGRVRSVSVSAPFGGKVRQQLRVEQHLEATP